MATVFIVELPPPYGGVTVKNKLILDKIVRTEDSVRIIDLCKIKKNILYIFPIAVEMISSYLKKDTIVYGLGTHKRLKKALIIQNIIGGSGILSKTNIIVMGGLFPAHVKDDSTLRKLISNVRCVLVETDGMKTQLASEGINNVMVYPNPKPDHSRENSNRSGILKCVFFSKICKGKGVDYIISELNSLTDIHISLDFYGPISNDIKDEFNEFVRRNDYVRYNGVFDSTTDELYEELRKYDLLLLPTKYKTEGIPGILIETKMAGVAALVSNMSFNAEIVRNNEEGIVFDDFEEGTLARILMDIQSNRKRVEVLKQGAFTSRRRYCIEEYYETLRELFDLN